MTRLAVVALLAVAAPISAQRVPYRLLPESRFEVRTGTEGLLGAFAHEHVVRADSLKADVRIDPRAPGRSHVELVIPVVRLRVVTEADAGQREEIRRAMLEQVLLAEAHPQIRFTSYHGEEREGGVTLVGALTLVGVTRGVRIPLDVDFRRDTVRAVGTFRIKQTHFGIEPYSVKLGTVRVADEVVFEVDVVAVPAVAGRDGGPEEEGAPTPRNGDARPGVEGAGRRHVRGENRCRSTSTPAATAARASTR